MERIGLISDTHGKVPPPVFSYLEGVDHILHAGDVGSPEVLTELGIIAPVQAVRGNVDSLGLALPEARLVEIAGLRILVVHIIGRPGKLEPEARRLVVEYDPDVVVFGHSHRAEVAMVADDGRERLFVNPGGAGQRRFNLPRSVGVMEVGENELQVRIFDLDAAGMALLEEESCNRPQRRG